MLLPVVVLLRRADTAGVIGAALVAKVAGAGYRRIAVELGWPVETVRGWLRRFGARLEAVRRVFTVLVRSLGTDPVMPPPTGGRWGDAVGAITAAAWAATVRFVMVVPPWALAAVVSGGRLLAPGWPPDAGNSGQQRATRVAPDGGWSRAVIFGA